MSELSIEDIMQTLPHRYPFLLVDRVLELDEQAMTIVGLKNVTINEPFFQGHFPGRPVMPGVLQLEAMAQTAGIMMIRLRGNEKVTPYFMAIDKAKFRRIVKPGDQLRIEVKVTTLRGSVCRFAARILVDGAVASQAEMMCMLAAQEGQAS